MKKRFCGPEYWKAVLKYSTVLYRGATDTQFRRFLNGLEERLETDKINNSDKWENRNK